MEKSKLDFEARGKILNRHPWHSVESTLWQSYRSSRGSSNRLGRRRRQGGQLRTISHREMSGVGGMVS
jgi:hypothetical protein